MLTHSLNHRTLNPLTFSPLGYKALKEHSFCPANSIWKSEERRFISYMRPGEALEVQYFRREHKGPHLRHGRLGLANRSGGGERIEVQVQERLHRSFVGLMDTQKMYFNKQQFEKHTGA